jgi:hypothetical protein
MHLSRNEVWGEVDRRRSGVREGEGSAGINRIEIGNESVLRRKSSQLLWPPPEVRRG